MTTYVQSPNAKQQFLTDAGVLAVGYLLYTYAAGTSTPLTTYVASTGGANTNPIVLDARGEADIWLDPALSYKYVLKTAAGATVWTIDTVSLNGGGTIVTSSSQQAQTYTAFTTGGTATAQTLTPSPALTAYAENQRFAVEFNVALGASPTLAVSGLAAKNLKYRDSTGASVAIAANTVPLGWRTDIIYDGTEWLIMDMPAAAAPVSPSVAINNLLTNPNWNVDQINEGALYTYSSTAAVGPDGWSGSATGAGVFKLRTLADPDNAALKCLEITCTTADASLAATDNYFIYTMIEGYDTVALKIGTSAAQTISVQFKFKTTTTGVYGISVANSATNRSYVGTITVADTSEHEYLVTLTLDTTGTWLYTNGVGLYLRISLAAGSNFCTTAGSWGANNMFSQTASQATFMGLNTNTAYLKRIQLFVGTAAQEYSTDVAAELAQCQRYYCKTFSQGVVPAQNTDDTAGCLSGYAQQVIVIGPSSTWMFPVTMRAAPTIITYNPSEANANWGDGSGGSQTVVVETASTNGVAILASTATNSFFHRIHATANARLA